MCRSVLVEQGVVVDAAGLTDARGGVDERNLAEPPPHPVGVDEAGDEVTVVVGVGLEPDEPSFRELPAEPVDQTAAEGEREGALERPARLPRVRAREDLLGRHVRGELPTVGERLEATEPARAFDEAEIELRARPTQLEAREPELRQPRRAAAQRAQVLAPAGGSLPVAVGKAAEAQQVGGEAPLRLERLEVRVDLAGPVVGRPARDDPARLHVQLRAAQEAQLLGPP